MKGTLVRGANDRDIPSHGRIWIDSATGRILRTELISEDTEVRALIDVSYRSEAGLDLLVPAEMRELYEAPHAVTHRRARGVQPVSPVHRHDVGADEIGRFQISGFRISD